MSKAHEPGAEPGALAPAKADSAEHDARTSQDNPAQDSPAQDEAPQGVSQNEPQELARRTDIRSFFVVAGFEEVRQLVIAALSIPIFAAMLANQAEKLLGFELPVLLIIITLIALYVLARLLPWLRFTYRLRDSDILVESGVLSRHSRSVPYERIQDVSFEQGAMARLLGLVEVRFETGTGGDGEVALAYLAYAEAEALRERVRARCDEKAGEDISKPGASAPAPAALGSAPLEEEGAPSERLFAMTPKRLFTYGMFEFSLAAVALGAFVWKFGGNLWFDTFGDQVWQAVYDLSRDQIMRMSTRLKILSGVIALLFLLSLGFLTGLTRTALHDWHFRLDLTSRGFRRRRGLLARSDVLIPRHRVQALKMATRLLRQRYGWHNLQFISLGRAETGHSAQGADSAQTMHDSHHMAAPFARLSELEPIIRAAGFAAEEQEALQWHSPSSADRNLRMISVAALVLLVAALIPVLGTSWGLDALSASPLYWLAMALVACLLTGLQYYEWRAAANALSVTQLYSREGVFAPATIIASRIKLQSAEIIVGPIGRRLGYATLHLGLAGGRLALRRIPLARAQLLRRAVLDSIAHADADADFMDGADSINRPD